MRKEEKGGGEERKGKGRGKKGRGCTTNLVFSYYKTRPHLEGNYARYSLVYVGKGGGGIST